MELCLIIEFFFENEFMNEQRKIHEIKHCEMSVISRSPFNSFNFIAAHSLRMDGLIEIKEELTGLAAPRE